MVAPTQQVSYVITAGNVGTQTGTNVVITDTYPVDILTIVDPVGGVVDTSAGTITWNINSFEVGQTETFTIVAEVLPTASLDTIDQLFSNSVSVTDDGANGADPNPDNNESSESDMLLAGAGEPEILSAVPEDVGVPPDTSSGFTSRGRGGSDFEIPNTARILTSELLTGGGEQPLRTGENDLINGGHLLDEFTLPAPEIHCAPGHISYDYDSDPASLELLDWLQEPAEGLTPDEMGVDLKEAVEAEVQVDVSSADELHGQSADNEPTANTLQQQIEREANNLYGAGKKELLEAFKASV